MNVENLHKLVTKEDPYHFHKTLGIITFFNFIYQFYHIFFYGNMSLNSPNGLYLLGLHGLLPISSLIFHIPAIRNPKAPMIYPEFRLHSIIFGLRAIICAYFVYYKINMSYRIFTCYLTMLAADIASSITNQEEGILDMNILSDKPRKTLIRNMPFDESENISENQKGKVARFHSSMQVGATLYMLGSMDTAFFTLYGIQLPAFLMTLVRKNIIKPNMWHNIYTILLTSNILGYYSVPLSFIFCQIPLYFMFIHMRFNHKMNKYLAWSIIFQSYYILNYVFCEICPIDIIFTSSQELYIKRGLILYNFITNMQFLI